MKMILSFLTTFVSGLLFTLQPAAAQQVFRGTVTDLQNNPVAFCSVGIRNSRTAAVADDKGNYRLVVPDSLADRDVIFSSVGFVERHVPQQDLKSGTSVRLEPKIYEIKEVVVSGKKLKEKKIGQRSRPMLTFSRMFDQNMPSVEQGSIFDIYDRTVLTGYNFYIMPSSRFTSITLKLNVYRLTNGAPDSNLLRQNVLYRAVSTGWQHIDLSPYALRFQGLAKIGITLQLLDHVPDGNKAFVFGISAKNTVSKDLLFRYQPQGSWEAGAGTFIANLDIRYTGRQLPASLPEAPAAKESAAVQALAAYYQYKAAAAKTGYGKSKTGRFIDLGDAKIYVEEYGKGHPLVLLHGNNGSIEDFYKQIPSLSRLFRVIVLDTRGQGRSTDLSTGPYSYAGFADDLYRVIQALELKRPSIVGWSDGGNTALMLSLKHPNLVNKLVTIGANLDPSGVSDSLTTAFKRQLATDSLAKNSRLIKLMLEQPRIADRELQNLKHPVLVVAGADDVIKPEHTRLLAGSMPNAQLQIIAGATHYAPFEQAEQLNRLLIKFLE